MGFHGQKKLTGKWEKLNWLKRLGQLTRKKKMTKNKRIKHKRKEVEQRDMVKKENQRWREESINGIKVKNSAEMGKSEKWLKRDGEMVSGEFLMLFTFF